MCWSRIIFPLTPQGSSILPGILKLSIDCCLFKVMTEEPGGLQSTGLQRVRYNLETKQQQQKSQISMGPLYLHWYLLLNPHHHQSSPDDSYVLLFDFSASSFIPLKTLLHIKSPWASQISSPHSPLMIPVSDFPQLMNGIPTSYCDQ